MVDKKVHWRDENSVAAMAEIKVVPMAVSMVASMVVWKAG